MEIPKKVKQISEAEERHLNKLRILSIKYRTLMEMSLDALVVQQISDNVDNADNGNVIHGRFAQNSPNQSTDKR